MASSDTSSGTAAAASAPAGRRVLESLLLATEHSEQDLGAEQVAFSLAQGPLRTAQSLGHAAQSVGSATQSDRHARAPAALPVVMPLASNPEYEAVAPQLAARAETDMARRREALQTSAAAAGVTLEVQVRRGAEPYREIVAAATERAATLLVIRRRGRRGLLANLLIGEMVSQVLAHAPCSVLVVPREAVPWRRGVLVAVDPQQPGTELVAQAAALAAAARLPLHLVCVAARESESERALAVAALARAAAGLALAPAGVVVRSGAAHAEIIAAAQASGCDLIAVARHGGSALGRAWIGGVAQKVIGLASCAVLVSVG